MEWPRLVLALLLAAQELQSATVLEVDREVGEEGGAVGEAAVVEGVDALLHLCGGGGGLGGKREEEREREREGGRGRKGDKGRG